ncbi:hypothetical protein CC78DRAFT_452718, partial [Lojkania enalia]
SLRTAAKLYNMPGSSLQRRVRGSVPISQFNIRKRKLKPTKKRAPIQWILELD